MRTDPHRPGAIIPADYTFVIWYSCATTVDGWPQPSIGINCELDRAQFDPVPGVPGYSRFVRSGQHNADGNCCVVGLHRAGVKWAPTGNTGHCSVCGAYFVYGEVWLHEPTGEHIHLGHTCAEKYQMLVDLSELEEFRKEQKALRATVHLKKLKQERIDAFLEANPGLRDALTEGQLPANEEHLSKDVVQKKYVMRDLSGKLQQYSSLTDNQVALALRLAEEIRNPLPPEVHVPAPTGRVTVEGEVVSVKQYESQFGTNWKMTVKVREVGGVWLCWVSVPSSIHDEYGHARMYEDGLRGWLRGKRVRFCATLERGNEEHFAFGKRPTQARILELTT